MYAIYDERTGEFTTTEVFDEFESAVSDPTQTDDTIIIEVDLLEFNLTGHEVEEKERRYFKLHWIDGKIEDVEGKDIVDAISQAGYGNGAMAALDYWREP